MITAAVLTTLLAATGASHAAGLRHFQPARKSIVPKSLLDSKLLCGDAGNTTESVSACEHDFGRSGAVWQGDVNDDGINELLIDPGSEWSGTGGDWYFLFQEQGGAWVLLFDDWQTNDPEFDILPVVRGGYHDLRISIDWCVKWNGKKYEDYDDSDYHNLSPLLFDSRDWWNAAILWDIHYQGLRSFRLVPEWVPFPSPKNRSSANVTLADPKYGLKWIALFKGGVWRVRGTRAFLLVPQPAYTGAQKLEFQGDWLVIYGDSPLGTTPPVVARYNRRTKEMNTEANIR